MRLSIIPVIESKYLAMELSIATTPTDVSVKGTVNKALICEVQMELRKKVQDFHA